MPNAAEISIRETLDLLDGPFREVADGVAENRYALWLGSGISLSRMPGLLDVIEAVLDHLQTRADFVLPICVFRQSLEAILQLANISAADWANLDITQPVATWPNIQHINRSLLLNYARALDQAPAGLPEDYLVWNAVDVVGRYADVHKMPAVEHLAVAALAMEGVASDIATPNWDGLLERAVENLAGLGTQVLQVRVLPEDVRLAPARSHLYKFHGCAVLAGQDEVNYRHRLVGRASQINGWEQKAENRVLVRKLVDLVISKPTLMLGLSAQDVNIQTIFVAAQEDMAWPFPYHPPAFVFSEEQIGVDQRGLLQNVYRNLYGAHQAAINTEALLRSYGRSLLPALWLYVVSAKLAALIPGATPTLDDAGRERLRNGIMLLRNSAALSADPNDHEGFLTSALTRSGAAMTLFREGRAHHVNEGIYSPVSPTPRAATLVDPGLTVSGLPQLALGLGLLGFGESSGAWSCRVVEDGPFPLRVTSAVRSADIYFAATAAAATSLVLNGHVAEHQDAIVLHSQPIPSSLRRSPAASLGRTGTLGLREINVAELANAEVEIEEVLLRFKSEMVL